MSKGEKEICHKRCCMKTEELTKSEVLKKVKGLPIDKKKSVTCALIGHSLIQTYCFGYFNCARCGAQLGDSIGSYYPTASKVVIQKHKCDVCVKNAVNLTWKDKLYVRLQL